MIILFVLLILIGAVQILLWRRQQQRVHPLLQTGKSSRSRGATSFIPYHRLAQRSTVWLGQLALHLLGNRKNHLLLKNLGLLLIVLTAGAYGNENYLQFNYSLLLPILTLATLVAIYQYQKKKRRRAFEEGFAEALNLINSAIRSGHSATEGIKECGEKLGGLVGEEFRQISQRLDIGDEPERVFMASYKRLTYREYYFFITAILVNLHGGGQLREVMTRLGQLISNGRVTDRQKMAKTSELRMSVKILVVIPIAFFIFMHYMMPDDVDVLLHHSAGKIILYYAVGSICSGLLIIRMMMGRV